MNSAHYSDSDRVVFINEPKAIDLKDYQVLIDRVVRHFSRLKGVIAIYQYGSYTVPGISDLDLLIVCDTMDTQLAYGDFESSFEKKEKYLLMHMPTIITRFLFENLRYFFIPADFKLLWGASQPISDIRDQKIIELSIIAEYVIGLLATVVRMLNTRVVKIRGLLCSLHSFKYDLQMSGISRTEFPAGWQFVQEIGELRRNWFDLDVHERNCRILKQLTAFRNVACIFLSLISKIIAEFRSPRLNSYESTLKVGINGYITVSNNGRCSLETRKNLVCQFLTRLPYADAPILDLWVLSDIIIKVPLPVYLLLHDSNDLDFGGTFKTKKRMIDCYARFSKLNPKFGTLLPSLTIPFANVNLKWFLLLAARQVCEALT